MKSYYLNERSEIFIKKGVIAVAKLYEAKLKIVKYLYGIKAFLMFNIAMGAAGYTDKREFMDFFNYIIWKNENFNYFQHLFEES